MLRELQIGSSLNYILFPGERKSFELELQCIKLSGKT